MRFKITFKGGMRGIEAANILQTKFDVDEQVTEA
jgi:hypothetical protein